MNLDLENVIRQALTDAKDAGKDYLSQTEETVRAVRQVWPVCGDGFEAALKAAMLPSWLCVFCVFRDGDKIFAISRFRAIPMLTSDRGFQFKPSGLSSCIRNAAGYVHVQIEGAK